MADGVVPALYIGIGCIRQQALVEGGGAPFHLQPTGEDTAGMASPVDRGAHDLPNMEQSVLHIGEVAPVQFVLENDIRYGSLLLCAVSA